MVTISEKAQQKIGELLEEEKDAIGLRVYVKGGPLLGRIGLPHSIQKKRTAKRVSYHRVHQG